MNEHKPDNQSSNRIMTRFFIFLFRLILVVLTAIVLGSGIYFGFQFVYKDMILRPIENNAARISLQETLQEENLADERLSQLNNRLIELENQQDLDAENISELLAEISTLETRIDQQSQQLEKLIEFETELQDMSDNLEKNKDEISKLQETPEMPQTPIQELQHELWVLQAMELISRSRLYLLQNNSGLAVEDLENTRAILVKLQKDITRNEKPKIDRWITRLDLALGNLPDSPVLAADDLEIAWRMIVLDLVPQEELRISSTAEKLIPSTTETAEPDDKQEENSPTPTVTPKP
ncbi:MAG: hypothetical protein JEZ06_16090 [Anaerolineaceae bacterium]|nr:hypothetical protein [Anaerolineaceae bacterium]